MIPDNARTLRITAAAGTELAGASSPGTVRLVETSCSSRATVVYTPRGVLPHAASLRQPCGHCAIFPTAASRRSLGRISVPMWGAILSDPLPVVALVSRYLTNELIGREPLPAHSLAGALLHIPEEAWSPCGISPGFPGLSQSSGQVTHVLLTRSRLCPTRRWFVAPLACVKHAASVRPEPGSNSP